MILVKEGMSDKVGTLVQMGAMFVAGFAVAFSYNWKMTLVILATVPLLIIAGGAVSYIMTAMTTQSLSAYAAANAVAEEAFNAMRTVVAFGLEDKTNDRFGVSLAAALAHGERKGVVTGLGMAAFFFIMFNSYGLAFWYGSTLINSGELDVGTTVTVFFSVLMGSMAVGQGAPYLQTVSTARGAAHAIFSIIDRVPEIDSNDERGRKLDTVKGNIEFRDVKFTYPSRPEIQILKGLNITIEAGQTVALVGASGCGKSTSVGLIERFYDPEAGQVFVDGVDIKELSLPWWRSQVGLVQQEPILFARSIRENIRYGNLNVTDAEIEEAARRSNVHDFIMKLPHQYETLVGERGGQLSGGQKQRIAIARALVRNPKVLLLDEATSALDNKSEKIVQDALDKASVGRTTIIIAHRLSTIRQASQIFVFDKGVVIEKGTHTELMELGGYYKDLVTRQQVSDQTEKEKAAAAAAAEGGKKKKVKKVKKEGSKKSLRKKKSTSTLMESSSALLDSPSASAAASPDLAALESSPSDSPDLDDNADPDELVDELDDAKVDGDDKKDGKAADKAKEGSMTDREILKRTLLMSKPEWWLMGFGLFASLGAGVVFPLYSIIFSDMLQDLMMKRGDALSEAATFWALMFFALACGTAIFNYLVATLFALAGERLTSRLRALLFRAQLRQDIGWFDLPKNAPGLLSSRLSTDATLVQSITATRISLTTQTVAALLCGLIIALTACWQLALVVLACVPLVAVGGAIQMKAAVSFNDESKLAYEISSNIASECVGNIRTVVSLGRQGEFYEQYHNALKKPNVAAKKSAQVGGIGMAFSEFIVMAVMALAFWYGGRLCDPILTPVNTYMFGDVMMAIMAVLFGAMMAGQISTMAPDYTKARDAAEAIYQTLDRIPPIDSSSAVGDRIEKMSGQVSLRNLEFQYPARPTIPVLRGLSLEVSPGQTVALVGASGCGKSTIIQLLERFYDPAAGQVLVDGKDVKSLDLIWWREQVGLVQQEPILFACSIAENIRYGKDGVTQEQIEEAAKLANAHNFISGLPDKYETTVGERGAQLSGGQKQRIAIARALVRNPKILLLDEATSALDSESEHIVQEALDRARLGRTTLMIAHRLSTVQNADVIVAIDGGVVVEMGTHDELLEKKGFYYSLVQSQNRG